MKIGGELNKVNEAQFNVIIFGEKYWHGELLIMRNSFWFFPTNSDKQIKQQNSNKINKNKWSVCLFLLSSFCPFYVQIPMASTCFNMLKLTSYSSKKHLKDKLLIAIRHGAEGFSFSWGSSSIAILSLYIADISLTERSKREEVLQLSHATGCIRYMLLLLRSCDYQLGLSYKWPIWGKFKGTALQKNNNSRIISCFTYTVFSGTDELTFPFTSITDFILPKCF